MQQLKSSSLQTKGWFFSPGTDLWVMFMPVWSCWAVCFLLPAETLQRSLPIWLWVVIVLGIDVSHVWSTIFRTYLDREEFGHYRKLLVGLPFLLFPLLFGLAWFSEFWFWRVLAYVALFHFIKQQYGFLAIYKARAGDFGIKKLFSDKAVIYCSMLYPVLYWHFSGDRSFNWFIPNDFVLLPQAFRQALPIGLGELFALSNFLYWLLMAAWLLEECWLSAKQKKPWAWGKVLWLLTTAGNWYIGIVAFNSDIAFTLTNVVAHGIPYLALIHFYQGKKAAVRKKATWRAAPQLFLVLGTVLLLAFGEEYLWDMLLNREKQSFFERLFRYPVEVLRTPLAQSLALAALSMPQVWHYVIDGFIWKSSPQNAHVKQVLMG